MRRHLLHRLSVQQVCQQVGRQVNPVTAQAAYHLGVQQYYRHKNLLHNHLHFQVVIRPSNPAVCLAMIRLVYRLEYLQNDHPASQVQDRLDIPPVNRRGCPQRSLVVFLQRDQPVDLLAIPVLNRRNFLIRQRIKMCTLVSVGVPTLVLLLTHRGGGQQNFASSTNIQGVMLMLFLLIRVFQIVCRIVAVHFVRRLPSYQMRAIKIPVLSILLKFSGLRISVLIPSQALKLH